MKTLSQYLHRYLPGKIAQDLLMLYPDNDAVKIMKAEYPQAEVWDLLAQALYSGSKPRLPKIDHNVRGRFRAIEEE